MKHGLCKRWKVLLPAAVVIATVILYCFWSTQFLYAGSWSNEERYTGTSATDAALNHESSDQSSADLNNFTVLLHPEEHTHRAQQKIELQWNITTGIRRPDGVAKRVYLINGEFPSPAIELRSGDELLVNVLNQLEDEDVAIHWHGLRIANEMDGVVGLTQCGISPSQEMEYHLRIPEDQSGSFWWHSHSETQRADGLFGSLIVHKPGGGVGQESEATKYGYEEEQVLMVGDWYHRPAEDVLGSYRDWQNFKIEPAPDSLLVNGLGHFNCSMALKARPLDCQVSEVPSLVVSRRTRTRIMNAGALTGFSIATSGYTMTVMQVDGGHAVQAMTSQSIGVLYPGERVDVILERNAGKPAWIEISIDRENMGFPNLALTAQQQFPIMFGDLNGRERSSQAEALKAKERHSIVERIDLSKLSGNDAGSVILEYEPDQIVLLYATISYMTRYEYRPKGFFNHTSWEPQSSSESPLAMVDRADWPEDKPALIPTAEIGSTVDLVINNLDDKGHPLHFHGHDFFVIARYAPTRMGAFEQYNPFDGKEPASGPMNLESPVMKDTVYVPSMGYVVLRVLLDNPGLWLLHCHVLWHGAVGMNMALEVAGPSGVVLDAAVRERVADVCSR